MKKNTLKKTMTSLMLALSLSLGAVAPKRSEALVGGLVNPAFVIGGTILFLGGWFSGMVINSNHFNQPSTKDALLNVALAGAIFGFVILPTEQGTYEAALSPIEHSEKLAKLGVSSEDVAVYNSHRDRFAQDIAQAGEWALKQNRTLTSEEMRDIRTDVLAGFPASVTKVADALAAMNAAEKK